MVSFRAGKTRTRECQLLTAMVAVALSVILSAPVGAETAVGQSGTWVKTAMDDAGNIHLVYANAWGGSYYTKFSGGSWRSPVYLPNSSPCWFDFTNPDIDVGPDGIPQVVYGTTTGDSHPNDLNPIIYARATDQNGSGWNLTYIGDSSFRRNHARISVDESNVPHITYMKTNKSPEYWWEIIYRRPDGTEKIIQHTGPDSYRCNNPDIACKDGAVHITWFQGGSGTMTTNTMHAAGTPYGDFPVFEQLTNMPYMWFVTTGSIAIAPDGQADIVYLVQDFSVSPGMYKGVYSTRTGVVDGGWAVIDEEEREDWAPNIMFMNDGTRYVVWSHHDNGETMYVRNSEPKVTMTPWGSIDACAGNAGAYYVRSYGEQGPLYYQQLEGGAPPNQAPVALFTISPQSGDINTVFQLDASDSYDPDNNLPLTYRWDWNDDGDWDLEQVNVPMATHSYAYPGTYTIGLQVEDTRGGKGTTEHDVTVINHDPNASFTATIVGMDSVQFDASASSDVEDGSRLAHRWDWEDDGTYDTQWMVQPQILHVFSGPGIYTVRLQVRDLLWATGETMLVIDNLAPEPPTDLQVMAVEPLAHGWNVTLSWTPSSSEDVISQTVLRAFPQGVWEDLAGLGASTATYQDTVYQEGAYSYRISCANEFYVSYSDSVTIEAVGADGVPGIPQTLALAEVLPNPTSGSVSLRLAVPGPGEVSVTLHDMAGRTVAGRSLWVREASWVSWRWDLTGGGVPAGTYLVTLSQDGRSVSTPLVLIR